MGKYIDITGQKFNKLTVVSKVQNLSSKKARWLCKCDCGNFIEVSGDNLRNGSVKSCGCLVVYNNKQRATHRKSNIRLYNIWRNMKARCNNSNNPSYKNYGGRGIKIYEKWADFEIFYDWAINNGYKEYLTLDRIDVNGNYEPNNCRWITLTEQSYNKRYNIYFYIDDKMKCLAELCKERNLKYTTIYRRVTINNMPIEEAIETVKKRNIKEE